MAKLGVIMKYVEQIDEVIKDLRRGMAHTHPHAVDALRHYVDELELIKDEIMSSDMASSYNLDTLLKKIRECIRDCVRPSYADKPSVLPYPKPDPWKPPVTVTGVNIIFVCDISESMFEGGGLEKGGRVRKLLVDVANEIDRISKTAAIPCKVSLVTYADPTDTAGHNRPIFYTIELNKVTDVSKLANAFDNINHNKWVRGNDWEECGMTCIHRTIDTVIDKSIVNGKPVENSIILVSDERQKLHGSQHTSHPAFKDVTFNEFKSKLDGLKVHNRYALIPMRYVYTTMPTATVKGVWGGPVAAAREYNRDVRKLFRQSKEYSRASKRSDLQDWINWTLDPSKAPKNT